MLEVHIDKSKVIFYKKKKLEPKMLFKFNQKRISGQFPISQSLFSEHSLLKQAAKLLADKALKAHFHC